MAGKPKEPGPTSERVATNLNRIRRGQNISTAALSERLTAIGHPIMDTGITKAERGQRRVDVDDLVALAVALGATPNRLLMPDVESPALPDEVQLTPAVKDTPLHLWEWAQGERAPNLPTEDRGRDLDRAFGAVNRAYLTHNIRDPYGLLHPKSAGEQLTAHRTFAQAAVAAIRAGSDPRVLRRILESILDMPAGERDERQAQLAEDGER